MQIDLTKLKGFINPTNIGKLIAIIMAIYGLPGAAKTAPMAMSSSGVPVNDLIETMTPFVVAVLTWFGAGWLKSTPELVAAAIGLARKPDDQFARRRFEVATLEILKSLHGGNVAVMDQIARLDQELASVGYPPKAVECVVGPGGHLFCDGVCKCGQKTSDNPNRCPLNKEQSYV